MGTRLHPLARFRRRERLAIDLLRGGDLPFAAAAAGCFAELSASARAIGLIVFADGTPYVGRDEMRLLAWLALAQRRAAAVTADGSAALRDDLCRCAEQFAALGGRIDYHVTLIEPESGRLDRSCAAAMSVQAHILRLIRLHGGIASSGLQQAGVSRQMITLMQRRGLLQRTATGLYCVQPGAQA